MEGGPEITVRKVTEWQASWTPQGPGEPGVNTIQVILDGGAAEHVYTPLTTEDADNLFDWLSAGGDVYFDVERQSLIFGTRPLG